MEDEKMPGQRLVHGKGIYDSDTRCMACTGMVTEQGEIKECGDFQALALKYPEAEVLDYSDQYILPGLINTHVHLEFTPSTEVCSAFLAEEKEKRFEKARIHAREMLYSGVTTARDLGSSMETAEYLRKAQQESDAALPRLHLSGMPLTERNGHLAFLGEGADSEEELVEAVRQRKEAGCDCIKLIVSGGQNTPGSLPEKDAYDRKRIKLITEAAHERGLPAAAHCLTVSSFVNCMEAGVDCIEHCACFVRKHPENLLARVYEPQRMEAFRGDRRFFMIGFSNNYHKLDAAREGRKKPSPQEAFLLEQEMREAEIFNCLLDLGMRPVVGTDGGCGETYFDETWLEIALLVERCGLSEADAIHAATVAGAQALGLGDRIGRLKKGYEADFITMKENPLKHIRALAEAEHVVHEGRVIR